MQKLQIIKVNASNQEIEILGTFFEYASASEFLNIYIDKNYEINNWLKVYHNNSHSVSIYKYFYLYPKQLECKIHIIHYADIDNEENDD